MWLRFPISSSCTRGMILALLTYLVPAGLQASDWIIQWDAVERLAQSEEPEATAQLREIGEAPGASDWLKGRVLVGLASRDAENTRDEVLRAIVSSNAVMRVAACEALGIIGVQSDMKTLVGMVRDPDEATRYAAALALSKFCRKDAWNDVRALASVPTDIFIEQRAEILGNTFSGTGTNLLTHMLIRTNAPAVRLRTARALHRVRNPSLVPLLFRSAVSDRDRKVRATAESSLRAYDADFLADPLAEVFRADDKTRYPLAATLLLLRPSARGGDALAELVERTSRDQDAALLSRSMDALLAVDPARYRDTIGKYLKDTDPTMRMRAVTSLAAGRSNEEIYEILRKPLADPDDKVFMHALRMLEKRTDVPPEDGLVQYLEPYVADTNTTRTAHFLAFMNKRLVPEDAMDALDLLKRHLEGADEKLRQSAINVFKSATDEDVISRAMAAQGFLTQWVIVGPFDNDKRNGGFNTVYAPEKNQDLDAVYEGTTRVIAIINSDPALYEDVATSSVRRVTWERMPIASMDGSVRLNRLLLRKADYFTGYGLAEIHSPREQEVEFQAKGDDAIKVWLNGEKVMTLANPPIPKDKRPNRDEWEVIMRKWVKNSQEGKATVKLKQGRNRILVKCSTYTHAWYFSLRIARSDGARADVEEIELKKLDE